MRLALEQVIEIVTDARSSGEAKALPMSIYAGIKDLKVGQERVYTQIIGDSTISISEVKIYDSTFFFVLLFVLA